MLRYKYLFRHNIKKKTTTTRKRPQKLDAVVVSKLEKLNWASHHPNVPKPNPNYTAMKHPHSAESQGGEWGMSLFCFQTGTVPSPYSIKKITME